MAEDLGLYYDTVHVWCEMAMLVLQTKQCT